MPKQAKNEFPVAGPVRFLVLQIPDGWDEQLNSTCALINVMRNHEFQRKDAKTRGRQEGEKELRRFLRFFIASLRLGDFALANLGLLNPSVDSWSSATERY
jgi:hypothetical protein